MDDHFASLYLENQICFPLYAASRLTTKLYTPFLKELDITYPQYLVLLVLWQHNAQTVNKISERLLLETNTVTPLLKRLENKGLLKRERSREDERTVQVSLTAEGEKLKEKAVKIPEKIIGSFQDQTTSETEIIHFRDTLKQLVETLDEKLKR
ncbi:organic hydroperoxide resistance transcriptional regulator [Marivirga tractuosa]|uniref:Transcriptional regulator, MarR family n=1 Tax=Marivirga tractuosa (strain ATCC 23168 / DSM 4126 / NBRC 15989 / NCIMB 1408 / VKM B-1430 / H-43) TaxID=643867 RepID=E4TP70_MARTH|nr:MarR family transcriptional regulator [Marivirga tractuosa]ADR20473.1 transcriptional regulator, MarR family [Marivirga tractuosa DSM 4126]BDD15081.1 organic hydroperoxide resistance transcriptional regulator [Marivirga tractuosa]